MKMGYLPELCACCSNTAWVTPVNILVNSPVSLWPVELSLGKYTKCKVVRLFCVQQCNVQQLLLLGLQTECCGSSQIMPPPPPPPLQDGHPAGGGAGAPSACPSASCGPGTQDKAVSTQHVGVVTDPDCLGPCEPGTSVTLEGIVWHETDNGE